jgi:hypothetical protein
MTFAMFLFLTVFIQGGADEYPKGMLEEPGRIPQLKGDHKVEINVDYQFNGIPIPAEARKWEELITLVFSESKYFSEVGNNIMRPDLNLDIVVQSNSLKTRQQFAANSQLTVFTLGLFPLTDTVYYKTECEIFRRGEGQLGVIRLREGLDIYAGIFAAPNVEEHGRQKVEEKTKKKMAEVLLYETVNRISYMEEDGQ